MCPIKFKCNHPWLECTLLYTTQTGFIMHYANIYELSKVVIILSITLGQWSWEEKKKKEKRNGLFYTHVIKWFSNVFFKQNHLLCTKFRYFFKKGTNFFKSYINRIEILKWTDVYWFLLIYVYSNKSNFRIQFLRTKKFYFRKWCLLINSLK